MLSPKMQEALNAQINAEYYSSYLYLAMSAYCAEANLKGFANWFRVQSQEEMVHVMKLFGYVIDRKGRVQLTAIQAPPVEWASPQAVFEAAASHEEHVTALINGLVRVSVSENDFATHALLEWFITEQVEEEATVDAIVSQLRIAQGAPAALFLLDRELGSRVFNPAAGSASAT